jgi:hypothetical protein
MENFNLFSYREENARMRVHIIQNIKNKNEFNVVVRNLQQPLHVINNAIKGKYKILYSDYLTEWLNLEDIKKFKKDIQLCLNSKNYENLPINDKYLQATREICIEWSSYELEYV